MSATEDELKEIETKLDKLVDNALTTGSMQDEETKVIDKIYSKYKDIIAKQKVLAPEIEAICANIRNIIQK